MLDENTINVVIKKNSLNFLTFLLKIEKICQ